MKDCGSINGGTHGPQDNRLNVLLEKYAGRMMPSEEAVEFQNLCDIESEDATALAVEFGIFYALVVQFDDQMVEETDNVRL